MPRKKETLTLSIPPGTKEQLEAIARRLNILWGKEPSVSGLIVAIAQQQVEVGQSLKLNSTHVAALQQATKVLIDSGYIGEAHTLLSLLLEQGNLENPVRQSLQQLASQPSEAWRIRVDQHINHQQPFRLLYYNAQEQELEFTVRYAEISFEEKRFYLEIWCEETEDIKNTSFPELIHNRCLRLDRIKAIEPIEGQWHSEGLDHLKVYLHFYRGMVKAYEPRAKDISNEVVGEVRQVIRRVSNPFWLEREVLRYGGDCVVMSPENVRERVKQKLRTLCHLYDIETR
ncbi:helix-turn-helix transcriptional regulator [Coleofasciculus sp. G2-EDA-02]|uniref:helix-turn-helix transcriptional regulator n=1 Tax=Coleofasciculus sp. G2-EDA-02 TaxID=3069529 RepID=UPI0032FDA020